MRSEKPRQERAWKLLGSVEHHPQVRQWLQEAEGNATEAILRRRASWRRGLWAACASVAAIALGWSALTYREAAAHRYETQVGEQRDVMLADGSKVTLNTNSALVVRYSPAHRYLILERGEALFEVAHNAARPFDVAAGDIVIHALGTEFNVDLRPAKTTVSLLEGAVQVSDREPASDDDPGALQTITKGESLELRAGKRHLIAARAELGRIDAWRTRRLEFNDTPLTQAVEELNRYSRVRLVIGTPALRDVRITGLFRIGDVKGFLFSLREALGIEAYESANEVVLVKEAAPSGSTRSISTRVADRPHRHTTPRQEKAVRIDTQQPRNDGALG